MHEYWHLVVTLSRNIITSHLPVHTHGLLHFAPLFFLFSTARKTCGHKYLVGNQEGELHVFQIMVSFLFFLACDNSVHYSDIVWSNDLSVYFSFAFF